MTRRQTLEQPSRKQSQPETPTRAEPSPEKVYQQFVTALRRAVEKSQTPDETLETFVAQHFKKVPQQIVDLAVQRSGINEPVTALSTMMKKRMAHDGVAGFAEQQADPEQQFNALVEGVVSDIRAGADPDDAIKSAVDKISKSPHPDYLPNQGSLMTLDLGPGETPDPAEDLRLRISADYRLTDVRNEIWQKSQSLKKEPARRRGARPDEAKILASAENPIQVYREFVKDVARQIEDGRDANEVIEATLDEYLRNPIRATPREDLKKRLLAEARIVKAMAANPPKKEPSFAEESQLDPEKEFSTMAEIIADGILAGVPRELAISRAVDAYAKYHDLENLMGAGSEQTLVAASLNDMPSVRDQIIGKLNADERIIAANNEVFYGSKSKRRQQEEVVPAREYISPRDAFPYLKNSALENMRSGMNHTDAINLAIDHFIQRYGNQAMKVEATRLTLPEGGQNTARREMELLLDRDYDLMREYNRQRDQALHPAATRPTPRETPPTATLSPLPRPEAPVAVQPEQVQSQQKKPGFWGRLASRFK